MAPVSPVYRAPRGYYTPAYVAPVAIATPGYEMRGPAYATPVVPMGGSSMSFGFGMSSTPYGNSWGFNIGGSRIGW